MCHVMSIDDPRPLFASSLSPTPFDSGRKDGVDLVLIFRYVVIFVARFG